MEVFIFYKLKLYTYSDTDLSIHIYLENHSPLTGNSFENKWHLLEL